MQRRKEKEEENVTPMIAKYHVLHPNSGLGWKNKRKTTEKNDESL